MDSIDNWTLRTPVAIALGAVAGSLARYALSQTISAWSGSWGTGGGSGFPYATLAINVSGSVLMGMLAAASLRDLSPELRLMLGTGFLGSYTTFSTYALEAVNLWLAGRSGMAIVYWLGSAILGLVGVGVGMAIGRR